MRNLLAALAVLLVLAGCQAASADYIFDGSDGSFIMGEDNGSFGNPYPNHGSIKDGIANQAWDTSNIDLVGVVEVGGKYYLSNLYTAWGLSGFADTAWDQNAIQLTGDRQVLSAAIYNNGSDCITTDIHVYNLSLTAPWSGADAPLHYMGHTSRPAGFGTLVTQSTGELAPGATVTLTWDLFDNDSYTVIPDKKTDVAGGDGVAEAGDWLGMMVIRLYPHTLDYDDDLLLTDVQLLSASSSTVPEPGTWLLMGTGVLVVFGIIRRRRIKN
ncbi:MAG TPA: PEP-CTERM sorting domain-containing protein [Planctomycetota bacterium]|nr:PEP-CTERM sorting domain-containing protein [Planctomycetota bacterium]